MYWLKALSCDFSWSERAVILFGVRITHLTVLLAEAESGHHDVLNLHHHVNETQFGVDNHSSYLTEMLFSKYYIRHQHLAMIDISNECF